MKLLALPADCHVQMPLSVCHLSRRSCGRGYSGHGFRPTLSVQGVSRGGVLSWYAAAVVVAGPVKVPVADVVVLVKGVVVGATVVVLVGVNWRLSPRRPQHAMGVANAQRS